MADQRITALTAITTPASGDKIHIIDVSDTTDNVAGSSRQITFANLVSGLADAGANSDITSLTGLTTPLSVAQGGSGAATLTGILKGNGTSAFTAVTAPSGTIVGDTDTQTLTNKTLTAPIISSISNTGTLTLPTSTDTLVGKATTDTLTNKRITKRTGTTTSSATPTINTDNVDFYSITALAAAITSFTTNLSGTPTEAQTLWIAITDNGTVRAITWGASFEASGNVALPTTTVISTRLDVGFVWNSVTSKWRVVAVS